MSTGKSCCSSSAAAPEKTASCCSAPAPKESSCCSPSASASKESSCCSSSSSASTEKIAVHRNMTIEDVLSLFPFKAQRLAQEITNAGLHCVGCHAATWETLEAGMLSHGKTQDQIEELISRLNALLEEEVDASTISITKRAADKFLAILAEEGKQGWGMRFAERMAGCNGFEYVLDYSEKALPDDETFTSCGIEIHVNKQKVSRLLGSEIDYVDGLRGSGFKITNPNVRSSCGCGTSHGY